MTETEKGGGAASAHATANPAPSSNGAASATPAQSADRSALVHQYWAANLRLLGILMTIWFVASFVFGILLVDVLNEIRLFGFKLGFWFAQQGSIYIFIALIFVYALQIQKIERRFGVSDE